MYLFNLHLTQLLELFEPVPAILPTAQIDLSPLIALFINAL